MRGAEAQEPGRPALILSHSPAPEGTSLHQSTSKQAFERFSLLHKLDLLVKVFHIVQYCLPYPFIQRHVKQPQVFFEGYIYIFRYLCFFLHELDLLVKVFHIVQYCLPYPFIQRHVKQPQVFFEGYIYIFRYLCFYLHMLLPFCTVHAHDASFTAFSNSTNLGKYSIIALSTNSLSLHPMLSSLRSSCFLKFSSMYALILRLTKAAYGLNAGLNKDFNA